MTSIRHNIQSGRFRRYWSARSDRHPLSLTAYVDQVIAHVSREYVRLEALEQENSAEWNKLRECLVRRARPMIRQFRTDEAEIQADAQDFAQQTCSSFYDVHKYPCDVPFDAWMTTILKNLVLAHYTRSTDILDRRQFIQSLDQPGFTDEESVLMGELLACSESAGESERAENRVWLEHALAQLPSAAQRRVIVGAFFEGLSDGQLARELGKSKQAIYNLRNRALAELKAILTEAILPESPRKKPGEKSII